MPGPAVQARNQRHPLTDKMWPSPARILIIQLKQVDKWTRYKAKYGLAKVMCVLSAMEAPAFIEVFSTGENQHRLYSGPSI